MKKTIRCKWLIALGAFLSAMLFTSLLANAQTYHLVVPVSGVSSSDSGTGTSADCYDPSNVGTVGQSGWTGCAGLLIVENGSTTYGIHTAVGTDGGIVVDGVAYGPTNIFTGQVTDMSWLFYAMSGFNEDIGFWDTSNVTTMNAMFRGSGFSQDISGWDVSKVTNMAQMFLSSPFNHDISGWDVSAVTQMQSMFESNSSFNAPIGLWNTANVTNMDRMFYGSGFTQDISAWSTSSVQNMQAMFSYTSFNADIGGWDTSQVTNMNYMFRYANTFNQNLNGWCVTSLTTSPPTGFNDSGVMSSSNLPAWGTCPTP